MMWLLSTQSQGGHSYLLTKEKDHYVGRTSGEIILPGDTSVSRKHAVFKITSIESKNPVVALVDLGSKYGTYINETVRLNPNKPYKLKHGDIIKFGCQWNEWRFDSKPIVVATSTISAELKADLKNRISELGGVLVNDWQETCSHLTMSNITLTAKVVCALASAVPIVTPEYWTHFQEALRDKKSPPDYNEFVPPLKENVLNKSKVSVAVDEKRRTIFAGKTFVFSTEKQMKKYNVMISAAGGYCVLLAECGLSSEQLCKPDVVLMQLLPNETQNSQSAHLYDSALRLLRFKGGRPIPESEIGLAILLCSLDKYCNPYFNVVQNVLQGGSEATLSQLRAEEVLADDTQSVISTVTSVKMEKQDKSFDSISSIPDSSSVVSSSHKSDSRKHNIHEQETQPIEEAHQSISPEPKTVPAPVIPVVQERMSTRKRIAESDPEVPSAKKSSFADDSFQSFGFTSLAACRPNKNQNKKKFSTVNENDKRNHDADEVIELIADESEKNQNENRFSTSDENGKRKHDSDESDSADLQVSKRTRAGKLSHRLVLPIDTLNKPYTSGASKRQFSNELVEKTDSESRLNEQSKLNHSRLEEEVLYGIKPGASSSKTACINDDAVASTSKASNRDTPPREAFIDTSKKARRKDEDRMDSSGSKEMGMVVKMEALIIDRTTPPIRANTSDGVVNFKKFKKVRPLCYRNALPNIIGGSDLVAVDFDESSEKAVYIT